MSIVHGYSFTFLQNPRRGRLVAVASYLSLALAAVRRAMEASLSVQGAHLFNIIPRHLPDTSTRSRKYRSTGSASHHLSDIEPYVFEI